MKQTLSFLILGQRGGTNRIQIINALRERPYNLNQLAEKLKLNYRTIKHHVDTLLKHELISTSRTGGYGEVYFISPDLESNIAMFDEIVTKVTTMMSSPRLYQNVLEQTNDAVIIIDKNLSTYFWNDSATTLFGYSKEEILGNRVPIFTNMTLFNRIVKMIGDGKKVISFEARGKHKTGRIVDIEITMDGLRDENENLIGYSILSHDITERKAAEEALRRSEMKYRTLVDTLHEGIWAINKDSKTTFVNPRMAEILGYTPDEMLGRHLFSFMDRHGIEIAKRHLTRRKKGIKEQHEFEFIKKDGTKVFSLLETSPITDENGNYTGALAGLQDITERKHMEEELQKLASFTELNPSPMIEVCKDGKITYINPATKKNFPDIEKKGLRHPLFRDWKNILMRFERYRTDTSCIIGIKIGKKKYQRVMYFIKGANCIRICVHEEE
jgi:PAS domain S-box-containing protein